MTVARQEFLGRAQIADQILAEDTAIGQAVRAVAGAGSAAASAYRLTTAPIAGYNTRRFQQSIYARNIATSDDGWTYMAMWGTDQHPWLLKKRADSDRWTDMVDLRTVPGDPFGALVDDSHNTLSVAVDNVGGVHVFGNMHTVAMKYARTTTPGDLTSFIAGTVAGTTGQNDGVTYPDPFRVGDTLMLLYRDGLATQGQSHLQRWNPGTGTWTFVRTVLDGDPSAEGPYSSPVIVHPATATTPAKFGFFVTWREGGAADTNSGYTFIESSDLGVTWQRADGTTQPMPMTHANSVDAYPLEHGSGFINQCAASYDNEGRPRSGMTLYDGNGNTQYNLLHWTGEEWALEQISEFTTRMETVGLTTLSLRVARPALVHHRGRDYLIGRATYDGHAGRPLIFDATPGADHRPARLADLDLAGWEPGALDLTGLAQGRLHLLLTSIDQASDSERNWDRQWLGLASIDLARIADLAAGALPAPRIRPVASFDTAGTVTVTATADSAVAALQRAFISARETFPGEELFVKVRGRFVLNSGTTSASLWLRAAPSAGSLPTEDVCRFTMSSSIQGVWVSPWEPLLNSPYVEADDTIRRDTILTPWAVANNAAGFTVEALTITVGVLALA